MKVGIITLEGGKYSTHILKLLIENGIEVAYVFKGSRFANVLYKIEIILSIIKRHGYFEVFMRFMDRKGSVQGNYIIDEKLDVLTKNNNIKVKEFDYINSGKSLNFLLNNKVDIIVLAGVNIVSQSIISTATKCCLNGHPAILPNIRGVDVIEWSIYFDQPLGITIHKVTKNVDKGENVYLQEVFIDKNESLEELRTRMEYYQAVSMLKGVVNIIKDEIPVKKDYGNFTKLCFTTNRLIRKVVKDKYLQLQKK